LISALYFKQLSQKNIYLRQSYIFVYQQEY